MCILYVDACVSACVYLVYEVQICLCVCMCACVCVGTCLFVVVFGRAAVSTSMWVVPSGEKPCAWIRDCGNHGNGVKLRPWESKRCQVLG